MNRTGTLYQWHEVLNLDPACDSLYACLPSGNIQGVCPVNWHIPSDSEFTLLLDYLGYKTSDSNAMSALKSTTMGGNNASGFNITNEGGLGLGLFNLNSFPVFWLSSQETGVPTNDYAYSFGFEGSNSNAIIYPIPKNALGSIRCIENQ